MIAWIALYLTKKGMDKVDAFYWVRKIFIAFLAIALVLFIVIGFKFSSCREKRQTEQTSEKIKEANIKVIDSEIESNIAAETLENANLKTKEVEKNRESNVSFDEANRNRCLAFPEKCK